MVEAGELVSLVIKEVLPERPCALPDSVKRLPELVLMTSPEFHIPLLKVQNARLMLLAVVTAAWHDTGEDPVAANIFLKLIYVAKQALYMLATGRLWVVIAEVDQPRGAAEVAEDNHDAVERIKWWALRFVNHCRGLNGYKISE